MHHLSHLSRNACRRHCIARFGRRLEENVAQRNSLGFFWKRDGCRFNRGCWTWGRGRNWREQLPARRFQHSIFQENVFHAINSFVRSVEAFRFCFVTSKNKTIHLVEMKWTRAAPAKDDGLSASFIDDAIAFQAARNANRFAFGRICRDQFRIRPRAESLRAGNGVGRNQLDDAQSIFAIGDERELRGVDATDLHRARVIERAARVEHLIESRSLRIFDVDNRQAFRTVRDVGISARDIEAAGDVLA